MSKKSYKICCLADTHIRNVKYHKEYRQVFEQIYSTLREEKPDYIVHCGDIAHTKTQISPEFVEMCSDFLLNLSNIAPLYIILGNHDGNLKASSRQDAVTPVVKALNKDNIFLLKNSGEYLAESGLAFNVLSIFDKENWCSPTDDDRINIALHHGPVTGCKTDSGYELVDTGVSVDVFEDFDYAFLGDIHKTDQAMDPEGRFRYPGSTVQQNFGETNDKGFLIWDIHSKEDFQVRHIEIPNPKPFVNLEIDESGKVEIDDSIPKNCYVRLLSKFQQTPSTIRECIEKVKFTLKPETFSFLNSATSILGDKQVEFTKKEDLRNEDVQSKFIKSYLNKFDLKEEQVDRIIKLNNHYNLKAIEDDDVSRNIDYKIKSFEWDNILIYGKGNKIDFSNLSKIIGIFGKNFSGKSSLIDCLLFTIFGSISKNSRKIKNIINDRSKECWGKVEIERSGKTFVIERNAEKYTRRLKGKQTTEAKSDVAFYYYDDDGKRVFLNGETVKETNKNVAKYFGTLEDFLLTALSAQNQNLNFIEEGSTKRKEILGKFLDLDFFDNKFKLAKADTAQIKALVKANGGNDFDSSLAELSEKIKSNKTNTETLESNKEAIQKVLGGLEKQKRSLEKKSSGDSIEFIDIDEVESKLNAAKGREANNEGKIRDYLFSKQEQLSEVEEIQKFLDSVNLEELLEKESNGKQAILDIDAVGKRIRETEGELKRHTFKAELLDQVPCGPEFSHCKFIKDAYESQKQINIVKMLLDGENNKKTDLEKNFDKEELKRVQEMIGQYRSKESRASDLGRSLEKLELNVKLCESELVSIRGLIKDLSNKKDQYFQNQKVYDAQKDLEEKLSEIDSQISKAQSESRINEKELQNAYKNQGFLEKQKETLESNKAEHLKREEELDAFELYLKCMHPSGISFDIIKRSLPKLNLEINKILSGIVNFKVYFETEENRLNIYIQHPNTDPRPVEMGSGAEKSVAALGIRLALTSITSIPRSQLFILDEPATSLDEERMSGFIQTLDLLKNNFGCVFLISHLETLKDVADSVIDITKKDDFALINI